MSRKSRVVLGSLLAFTLLLLTPVVGAQVLENLPYSGGVLVARAIQQGRIQVHPLPDFARNPFQLTCTPAPCAFPNVQASPGPQTADEHPFANNPKNALQLFTGANDLNCSTIVGHYASDDGGTTWKHACLKLGTGATSGAGDPVGDYDLNNNLFAGGIQFLNTGKGVVEVSKSIDNGTTWGAPVQAVTALLGYLADKPWMETDKNANSPFKNNIYISATQFASSSNSEISVSHSSDAGATYTTVAVDTQQTFPKVDQFSDLAIGPDGTVYVSWLRCTANGPSGDCGNTNATMMISKSTDGGTTWSSPVLIATVKLTPDPAFSGFYGALPVTTSVRVSNIPVNAVSGSGGTATVYASFYNWTGTQMQVEVAKSTNGGTTWGAPVRVTTAAKDEFFQWINLAGDGKHLHATWLDRRNDGANTLYQPFLGTSTDGVTWGSSHAISSTKSNPNLGGGFGAFIGDYRASVWVGHAVYAVWPDTRTGQSQAEVGGAQFP